MACNTTHSAPFSWTPSSFWDGNDGQWNTFIVEVGSPPQEFRVLPSTAGQETWLPDPEGCTAADPSDPASCGYLRGALPYHGMNSSGFHSNTSSSWSLIGPFTLDDQEANLGYAADGNYGFDAVTAGNDSHAVTESKQVVATVADYSAFWLGLFGIGPKSINFTNYDNPIPSFLSTLACSRIPSLSWGYTAGAAYRQRAPASLILGGYDANRFVPTSFSMPMNEDDTRPLQVAVQKIIGQNVIGGAAAVNLLPTPTFHFVDSTVPHIWLPDDAIEAFVTSFGLIYDNNTDLFLVNETMRNSLLAQNPTITFVLGQSTVANDGTTQNIELPYAAFDLQASYPYYETPTRYFPIRRAANETQYTFGRTFFQEAFVIADYERHNFTVAQASFDSLDTAKIVAIEKPTSSAGTNSASASNNSARGLQGGALAGLVVGSVVAAALLAILILVLIWRRRARDPAVVSVSEKQDPDMRESLETPTSAIKELPVSESHRELLDSKEVNELDSCAVDAEAEGDLGKFRGGRGMVEVPHNTFYHELDNS